MLSISVTGLDWYRGKFTQTPWIVGEAFAQAVQEVKPIISGILMATFTEAAEFAGAGFPPVYLTSLLSVVQQQSFDTMTTTDGFYLFFDFEELGDYTHLIEGAHHRAFLEDGGLSDIPYTGEALKNPILLRYLAWLKLPDEVREDTYETRAMYWESIGKAPQWLLLNYGQTLYSPPIMAYPVVEVARDRVAAATYTIVERILNQHLIAHWKPSYEGKTLSMGAFTSKPGYEWIRVGNRFAGSRKT